MTRVLIVSDYAFSLRLAQGGLNPVSAGRDDEVFLLLCNVRPSVRRRLRMQSGGFWRRTHAGLDQAIIALSAMGAAADGLASDAPPGDAVRDAVASFDPDQVLVSLPGTPSARLRADLGDALAGSTGRRPDVTWVTEVG